MNEMPMADKYYFRLYKCPEGLKVELAQFATKLQKVFTLASGTVEGLTNHMQSLTNVQCDDWFKRVK